MFGHELERAVGCERAAVLTVQFVDTIAIDHELAVLAARTTTGTAATAAPASTSAPSSCRSVWRCWLTPPLDSGSSHRRWRLRPRHSSVRGGPERPRSPTPLGEWANKYTNPAATDYFGDQTLPDMGVRVDTDATCSRPTNTFLHLSNGISFTPPNTAVAEEMTCGARQTLSFDDTNFLMTNKVDGFSVTTYFVTKYESDHSSVGCNDLLGFTTVTFQSSGSPIFITMKVLAFEADTNRMMSRIVENISGKSSEIVRVAETYLHELGHQSGLLHDEDRPNCADDTTLHITKIMHPGGTVRRALTRMQWCLMRGTWYVTSEPLTPFTQAPELPESGSVPPPPVP
jgi:hypothetical protein